MAAEANSKHFVITVWYCYAYKMYALTVITSS